jgi:hypothetical protein
MVCAVSQVQHPGDYLCGTLGDVRYLVVRGPDKQLRAFHNVSTQLLETDTCTVIATMRQVLSSSAAVRCCSAIAAVLAGIALQTLQRPGIKRLLVCHSQAAAVVKQGFGNSVDFELVAHHSPALCWVRAGVPPSCSCRCARLRQPAQHAVCLPLPWVDVR